MLKTRVRTIGLAMLALAFGSGVQAQKPVYLCNGVYTDQPCKAGKEVDIAPTRGLDSMSGQRRESLQVMQERMTESSARAQKKGEEEAQRLMRCAALRRQRLPKRFKRPALPPLAPLEQPSCPCLAFWLWIRAANASAARRRFPTCRRSAQTRQSVGPSGQLTSPGAFVALQDESR